MPPETVRRLWSRLEFLYGERAEETLAQVLDVVRRREEKISAGRQGFSERDVALITYGDQVRSPGQAPLATLRQFLNEAGLQGLVNVVHLLPFFPYSSDDGFSVIDFRQVDPNLGDWGDVQSLGDGYDLMFDLVLNHVSQQSRWFQRYLAGDPQLADWFVEVPADADLSRVVRPRSLPLVSEFESAAGVKRVWTTFSRDQVDLNYGHPPVLVEMLDILLTYVARGARIVRLDAIAYLWKEPGTASIHLPQTHEVVKLFRDVLDSVAPHVLLLTETNVPHRENVSYFGAGDEAHMVYQFSLPPLLLDAFLRRDGSPLKDWLASLEQTPPGTTWLNFTASHDGIGVRPLEGLVSPERLNRLVEDVRARGGLVSDRRQADGTDSPYELNVTYFSALGAPGDDAATHARRFLASQGFMLALRGVPAVYFHSLVGTPNDREAVEQSGQPRRINRRKFTLEELRQTLAREASAQRLVFDGYRRLLSVRVRQPAFHPDGAQELLPSDDPAIVALLRTSPDGRQRVLSAVNLSESPKTLNVGDRFRLGSDWLSNSRFSVSTPVTLKPYELRWITVEDA